MPSTLLVSVSLAVYWPPSHSNSIVGALPRLFAIKDGTLLWFCTLVTMELYLSMIRERSGCPCLMKSRMGFLPPVLTWLKFSSRSPTRVSQIKSCVA